MPSKAIRLAEDILNEETRILGQQLLKGVRKEINYVQKILRSGDVSIAEAMHLREKIEEQKTLNERLEIELKKTKPKNLNALRHQLWSLAENERAKQKRGTPNPYNMWIQDQHILIAGLRLMATTETSKNLSKFQRLPSIQFALNRAKNSPECAVKTMLLLCYEFVDELASKPEIKDMRTEITEIAKKAREMAAKVPAAESDVDLELEAPFGPQLPQNVTA